MFSDLHAFRDHQFVPRNLWGVGFVVILGLATGRLCLAAGEFQKSLVVTQIPVERIAALPANSGLRAPYGRGARIVVRHPDGQFTVLTKGFASACDPDVAYDGLRILFAGQKRENRWPAGPTTAADTP